MQTIGQVLGGRTGEKVEELDLGGLKKAIDGAREALSVIDISAIRQVVDLLNTTKDESEKIRAILDQLATVSRAVLAQSREGFGESEAIDKLFHDLETALISVDTMQAWLDQRLPKVWR